MSVYIIVPTEVTPIKWKLHKLNPFSSDVVWGNFVKPISKLTYSSPRIEVTRFIIWCNISTAVLFDSEVVLCTQHRFILTKL